MAKFKVKPAVPVEDTYVLELTRSEAMVVYAIAGKHVMDNNPMQDIFDKMKNSFGHVAHKFKMSAGNRQISSFKIEPTKLLDY